MAEDVKRHRQHFRCECCDIIDDLDDEILRLRAALAKAVKERDEAYERAAKECEAVRDSLSPMCRYGAAACARRLSALKDQEHK